MAGRGGSVAPKERGQRRRYNQPARGEWVDLEPLEEPLLTGYDEMRFTIPVWLWQAWRADAVTSQYGEADMLQSGSGAWGVYPGRSRDRRLIGWNNTFKTFREARAYARYVDRTYFGPMRAQYEQQVPHHKEALRGH